MEKISGIIPSSSRVTSVDLKDAAPVRPGTPAFGRPEGVSSLSVAPSVNTSHTSQASTSVGQKSASLHRDQMDWRSRDHVRAASVQAIADRFFGKNTSESVDETLVSTEASSSQPGEFVTYDPEDTAQPEGLYPKGSFIDYAV